MSHPTAVAPRRGRGRPRAQVQLQLIATNFDPDTVAAIERVRQQRAQNHPKQFTTSHAIRELVRVALSVPEYAELAKGPAPAETSPLSEPSTTTSELQKP